MCGISGIIFNNYKKNSYVNSYSYLLDKINDLDNIFKSQNKINLLYDLSWNYKNDKSFLNFFKKNTEKEFVNKISIKIDEFLKKINYLESEFNFKTGGKIEKIKDIKWFLKEELQQNFNFIKNFIDKDDVEINDTSIIFLKNLASIINSINFLEMRGRDSLGISINLNMKNIKEKKLKNIKNISNYKKHQDLTSVTFVFKISNSIGYLGENSENIVKQMKNNKAFLKLILNSQIVNGSIICHTRWASVGKVNNFNCHPISNHTGSNNKIPYINTFVNGDIYNYKEIIKDTKKNYNLNSKCTSDTIAVPYIFTDKNMKFENEFVKSKLNKIVGSYALAIETNFEPNKVLIAKSGSQGLYVGMSDDNFIFSSDVYGLVENCRYYYSIPSDYYFFIDKTKNKFKLLLNSLNTNEKRIIKSKDFIESVITTRDISKMNYSHFLEKEINQTDSILNRTCISHVNINKLNNNYSNFFGNQFHNIDSGIIKKIRDNSFKEIIITGMGTCYTAAVVISRYMRKVLRYQNPKIIVQPHIASEGSAFYLKNNMKDTLVIVIAQSGTTIDTNVYVKLSKNRGAKTLSIVNKRDGDVTFLVDSSIYLGNGRDIEIAVPSTKTFNAHIITGYLLSLFFYYNTKKPNKKFLFNDAKRIIQTPKLADKSIKNFHNLNLKNKDLDNFLTKKNWFMLHDDSEVSASCQEVRIKLSECCYSSVPYHNIDYIKFHKITNSIIIMMIGNKNSISIKELTKLSKNNLIYIISSKLSLNIKNITVLKTPKTENFFSFLPSVIYGQLLSYKIALRMDERKIFIQKLINNNFDKNSIMNLRKAIRNNIFVKGIEIKDLNIIEDLSKSKNNKKNQKKAKDIINIIKRPIDTIKHQAKTITVGTQRIQKNEKMYRMKMINKNLLYRDHSFYNQKLSNFFSKHSIDIKKKSDIFFYSEDLDETIIYFGINYLNNYCSKFNIKKNFHLARSYDLNSIRKDNNNLLVNINNRIIKKVSNNQINISFSNQFKKNKNILSIKKDISVKNKKVSEAIDIFSFSNNFLLSLADKKFFKKIYNTISETQDFLFESIEVIKNLKILNNLIKPINELLQNRNNVKIIGSGVNYNVAKIASKILSKKLNLACAHDVLENHKHVDMSAEPMLFVFISNINNTSYQMDAKSEIEKFISHGNIPILILNSGDTRFDNMKMLINGKLRKLITIKFENIYEDIAFIPSLLLIENVIKSIR
jgi:glucosamine 6-phosphate synthetase-like amidotransferase/phosphosugar isomerase protein